MRRIVAGRRIALTLALALAVVAVTHSAHVQSGRVAYQADSTSPNDGPYTEDDGNWT